MFVCKLFMSFFIGLFIVFFMSSKRVFRGFRGFRGFGGVNRVYRVNGLVECTVVQGSQGL